MPSDPESARRAKRRKGQQRRRGRNDQPADDHDSQRALELGAGTQREREGQEPEDRARRRHDDRSQTPFRSGDQRLADGNAPVDPGEGEADEKDSVFHDEPHEQGRAP